MPSDERDDTRKMGPASPEDPGEGLRFTHVMAMQTKSQVSELTASVQALAEVLIAEGVVSLDALEKRRRLTLFREDERCRSDASVEIADAPDKYALTDLPAIDCADRLDLCKARCCSQPFLLSVQDLDERIVRWDYARPYRNARRADGACVHLDGATSACTIHDARPAACRVYDCRRDRRIWLDFEGRIPAP